jgi:hypothetical protein
VPLLAKPKSSYQRQSPPRGCAPSSHPRLHATRSVPFSTLSDHATLMSPLTAPRSNPLPNPRPPLSSHSTRPDHSFPARPLVLSTPSLRLFNRSSSLPHVPPPPPPTPPTSQLSSQKTTSKILNSAPNRAPKKDEQREKKGERERLKSENRPSRYGALQACSRQRRHAEMATNEQREQAL